MPITRSQSKKLLEQNNSNNTDTISESQKTDQTASYEPNNTECDPNVLLSSSVHRPEAGAEGSPTHCASTDKSSEDALTPRDTPLTSEARDLL